ncbi:hypothetical protein [Deinococcus marmoris]|uniref:hypothetical protein n=1 Tax=Deinococcus marmoris TaxID=249408 RepID=UPI000496F148|nr:hypothetical protein [Deinococcus marmoris]
MKTANMAFALALVVTVNQASAVDLWGLLGKGDTTLPGGNVVYQLNNAAGVSVDVGLDFGELMDGGYTSLQLTAFKFSGTLNAQELQLFASNVMQIAAACFNTDPSRAAAIQSWISSSDAREENFYYTAGTRFAEKSFGPLQLALEKRSNGKGRSMTVYLSRKGVPGQAPWIKSCSASG